MWLWVEKEACAKAHSTVADLKKPIEAAWKRMNHEDLCKAFHSFRG